MELIAAPTPVRELRPEEVFADFRARIERFQRLMGRESEVGIELSAFGREGHLHLRQVQLMGHILLLQGMSDQGEPICIVQHNRRMAIKLMPLWLSGGLTPPPIGFALFDNEKSPELSGP